VLTSFGEGLYPTGGPGWGPALLSCLLGLAGIALLGRALWLDVDLQPQFNMLLGEATPEVLHALGRGLGLLFVGFYALQRSGQRLLSSAERRLRERQLHEAQRVHAEKALAYLPSIINLALANAVVHLSVAAIDVPAAVEWLLTTTLYILPAISVGRGRVLCALRSGAHPDRLDVLRRERGRRVQPRDDFTAALHGRERGG
jgi:moderate conductance mechanosensitive channel